MKPTPLNVFVSYDVQDANLYLELVKRLRPFERKGDITIWSQDTVGLGKEQQQEIADQLRRSSLILLLVSPDFIASEQCYSVELERAIERHHAGKARVVPIILRRTDITDTPFQPLQGLPRNAQSLTSWSDIDEAFYHIVQELRSVIKELQQLPPLTSATSPLITTIPHARNIFFTGRDDILERLHRGFQSTLIQAISGLGGIGKTQTAIEYTYRYQNEYETLLWIKADTFETIAADVAIIAEKLKLPGRDEDDPSLVMNSFKQWLINHEHWLLILDNADDLTLINDFPPLHSKGHTLITTRVQIVGNKEQIALGLMTLEEGALLVLRRARILSFGQKLEAAVPEDQTGAKQIVEEMDRLPLALEQAGAYLERTRRGISGYLQLYQTSQKELLQKRNKNMLPSDYQHTVMTAWSVNFESVKQANAAAADLLYICAFLAPDDIPEELFSQGAAALGQVLQEVGPDPMRFDEACEVLNTYSLLTRNNQLLTIHRLVQVALKQAMTMEQQREWAERVVKAMAMAFPAINYKVKLQGQQYLPHALSCATLIEQWTLTFPEAAKLLNQTAFFLAEQAKYTQAEPLYLRAVSIGEQALGTEHPDMAITLNNLATLYRMQGRYDESERRCVQAIDIRKKVLGDRHPDTAQSLNSLANLYHAQAMYLQAEPLYLQALVICEQDLEVGQSEITKSMNSLAFLYRQQEKYEQAEPLYRRTLAIIEQYRGAEHPSAARVLNNLAELYVRQGKYEQAEPLCQRALAIREKQLGPEHPNTATSLNNLANLYGKQGKYEQAESLCLRALAIYEQQLGPEYSETASSLRNLAILYNDQEKYEQAEPLFQRALTIQEQTLGPEHPSKQNTRRRYVSLLRKTGRDEEADLLEAPRP